MKNNYNRSIKLLCITCGSDNSFSIDDVTGVVTCKKCNRIYHGGKEELIELNQNIITKEMKDLQCEFKNDLVKELKNTLKKSGFKIK